MGILRFLLALSVLISHSSAIFGFQLVDSVVAVQSFFIISGFYITLILNEKYVGNNSYKTFIINRFLRLFPIYWIILFLSVIACYSLYLKYGYQYRISNYAQYLSCENYNLSGLLGFAFTNLFIFGQDALNFFSLNSTSGTFYFSTDYNNPPHQLSVFLFVPQAWSIALEIMFYLIAPFILRRRLIIIIFIIFAGLLIRYLIHKNGFNPNPWNYMFFPSEIAFFLFGALSYEIYKKIQNLNINAFIQKTIFIIALVTTVSFQFFGHESLMSLAYYIMLIACIPFLFLLTKNIHLDKYIGELSYPIYISHTLVQLFVGTNHFITIESRGTTLAIFTILFSILLNKFISSPIEKIRQARVANNLVKNAK